AGDLAPEFDGTYWRSLRNAPPVTEWLAGAIDFLSGHQQAPLEGERSQLLTLLQLLQERRGLLVLDNLEAVLEPGAPDGRFRAEFDGYGSMLQTVGESGHRSCLVVTSREAPPEWSTLGSGAIRTVELGGLSAAEARTLLEPKNLTGADVAWVDL